MSKLTHEIADAILNAGQALAPAALGSAVAQAYQHGLSWRDRLVQWAVGIVVSYYVTKGVVAWLELSDFVGQAIGFVLATFAFQATPRVIAGASETLGSLPGRIADWLLRRRAGE